MIAPPVPPPAAPPSHLLPAPPGVNHGAGLLALPGGDLLACWYSGRSEAGPDAVILCARGGDQGARWSDPAPVSAPGAQALTAPAPAKSVGNVVLARAGPGRIVMISGEIQSRRVLGVETCRTWRCGRVDFRLSSDDGRTWSAPTRLDDRPGALPRSRPLHVGPATDLAPVYQERGRASVLRLDLAALVPGRRPSLEIQPIPAAGPLIQPSLAPATGADPLRAYLRDPRRRFVHTAAWDPARRAWSTARPTDVENPGSAVEAFRDLRGRVVLIHNRGRRDRRTLALSVSADGVRFPRTCDLVASGAAGDAAYPAVADLGPGVWGVIFSVEGKRAIAYARVDQRFIDACAP
jgi:hypothetical protein